MGRQSYLKYIFRNRNEAGHESFGFVFFINQILFLVFLAQAVSMAIFSWNGAGIFWGEIGIFIFKNRQFAFSLPVPIGIMYAVYGAVLAVLFAYLYKAWNTVNVRQKIAWGFILAGAISNVGERIITGHVKDFIYFFTGVFNLADIYIILGLVFLLRIELAKK